MPEVLSRRRIFHNLTGSNVDISLVRPPYKSVWPIEEPSKEEIEQLVREAGADRIKSSIGVGDVGVHDFGEYTMGRVRSFKTRSSKTGMLDRDPVDKENFNGMWARKWVIKRAINFGWNQNLFNDFDRSRYVHDGERYGRRVERIGKKYQWIAYYELLARLADNLDLDDFSLDSGESLIAPLQATWQVGARDIEPTIIELAFGNMEDRFLLTLLDKE